MGYYSMPWVEFIGEVIIRCPRCDGAALVDTPFRFLFAKRGVRDTGEHPGASPAGWHWHHARLDEHRANFVLLPEDDPEDGPVPEDSLLYLLCGDVVVLEKYPSVLTWPSVKFGKEYDPQKDMVIKCAQCHLTTAHKLMWPDDAYFQWDIRGRTLWAWNGEHARALLQFIGGTERDETQFSYGWSLRKLPTEFISAKVRDLVVKKISDTLREGRT